MDIQINLPEFYFHFTPSLSCNMYKAIQRNRYKKGVFSSWSGLPQQINCSSSPTSSVNREKWMRKSSVFSWSYISSPLQYHPRHFKLEATTVPAPLTGLPQKLLYILLCFAALWQRMTYWRYLHFSGKPKAMLSIDFSRQNMCQQGVAFLDEIAHCVMSVSAEYFSMIERL
jgi:hypothetical protein